MIEAALAGLFGLLIGSFLNVCIYRKARDLSVVAPRSFCPACGHTIAWYDNIPLLSYALLRGRCRQCGAAISWRYPLVEAITALLFWATALVYGTGPQFIKYCLFEAIQIVLIFTDLENRTLHEDLTLGGIMIGLIFSIFVPVPSPILEFVLPWELPARIASVAEAAAGGILLGTVLWSIGEIHSRIRGVESLGFGDVELVACIGVFLGAAGGLMAVMIGSVLGSVIGLLYLWLAGKDSRTYPLPFGSFLGAGAIAAALVSS